MKRKLFIGLLLIVLLVFTACDLEVEKSETHCYEYIMPDGIKCDHKTVHFNGDLTFYHCEQGRTYQTPDYYETNLYLSNSTTC